MVKIVAHKATMLDTRLMSIPGTNIRLLRRQMGLSQRALAEATGLDVGNLSRLETGKSGYSRESIEKIAQVLSVSIGVLFAENSVVEAATLRMRQVPLLTQVELAEWAGPDDDAFEETHEYLHTDLRRTSRYAFALRIGDGANLPKFESGDDLIFDANKVPKMGSVVAAQDDTGKVTIGRLRNLPSIVGGDPMYEVVPFDVLYPIASTVMTPGLRLRGTLVEYRKYVL